MHLPKFLRYKRTFLGGCSVLTFPYLGIFNNRFLSRFPWHCASTDPMETLRQLRSCLPIVVLRALMLSKGEQMVIMGGRYTHWFPLHYHNSVLQDFQKHCFRFPCVLMVVIVLKARLFMASVSRND